MTRLEKLKKEHIKEVNKLVDEGFKNPDQEERPIVLKPSNNVTSSPKEFINKMDRLNSINKGV